MQFVTLCSGKKKKNLNTSKFRSTVSELCLIQPRARNKRQIGKEGLRLGEECGWGMKEELEEEREK